MIKLGFELCQSDILFMKRSFSQPYNIIYNIYKKSEFSEGFGNSKLGLARLLEASQGKTQHWERGQWPHADDLMTMHKKLGISYRWLVTGEGDPFGEMDGNRQTPPTTHIDAALLQQVIEMLEEHLQAVKGKLSPAAKATVVSQLYELLVEQEAQAREPIQMMRLVMGALAKVANE